jgi:hypothetical protein
MQLRPSRAGLEHKSGPLPSSAHVLHRAKWGEPQHPVCPYRGTGCFGMLARRRIARFSPRCAVRLSGAHGVDPVNTFEPLAMEPLIVLLVALAATALVIVGLYLNDRGK